MLAVFEFRFRLGLVTPIELIVEDCPVIANRNMQPGVGVAAACFQQQHPVGRDLQ